MNTTLGVGGIFDPAPATNAVQPQPGEAICSLGIPTSAHLVLPLVRPANVNSTAVLSGLWVGPPYVIGLISTTLLAIDMAIDITVGAAFLRHSVDPADTESSDPYNVQRHEYFETTCTAHPAVRPAG